MTISLPAKIRRNNKNHLSPSSSCCHQEFQITNLPSENISWQRRLLPSNKPFETPFPTSQRLVAGPDWPRRCQNWESCFHQHSVHISDHLSSGYPHVEQRWRVSCSVSSRQGRLYVTAIPLTPSWKWDKKQEIYNMVNNPDMLSYNHVRRKPCDSNDNVSEKPRCHKGRHHQLWFVWGKRVSWT